MYISCKHLLKKIANSIFNACGLKINRKTAVRTDLSGVLDHVSRLGFKPQTVIDIGVAYGTFELYEKFPDSTHLLVEPLKEYEGVLKEISRKYKAEYVIAAASSRPGTIAINIHPDLSSSSVYKESDGSYADGVPRKVSAVTIDGLCNARNLNGPYLMKIDAQGAELDILDGARKVLKDTELISIEASLFQFYVNGPQFYDIITYMKTQGFVVYDIFGLHNRPIDNALAQAEIIFVKENGQFRKHHFYATPEQRKRITKSLSFKNPGR